MSGSIDETLCKMIPYSDANYDYYCVAPPATSPSASSWRIRRVSKATGQVDFPDDNVAPVFAATSLAVVQAHFA